jgi:hypothetical protein
MQREGAVPGSSVKNKMTRIASLFGLSTKHIELLVRAALKSVFELCSLIASRSFSAPAMGVFAALFDSSMAFLAWASTSPHCTLVLLSAAVSD